VLHGAGLRVDGNDSWRCYFMLGYFVILCGTYVVFHLVCNITIMDDIFILFCGLGLGGADGCIDRF